MVTPLSCSSSGGWSRLLELLLDRGRSLQRRRLMLQLRGLFRWLIFVLCWVKFALLWDTAGHDDPGIQRPCRTIGSNVLLVTRHGHGGELAVARLLLDYCTDRPSRVAGRIRQALNAKFTKHSGTITPSPVLIGRTWRSSETGD